MGFIILVSLLVLLQVTLPRRFSFFPLVVAGCHLGNVDILPEFTPARLLILIGLSRALVGQFFVFSTKSKLDLLFLLFSLIAVLSSFGHQSDPWVPSPLSARAGLAFNVFGSYLYGRAYLPDMDTFARYAKILPIVLIPLAIGLSLEKRTGRNLYWYLGADNAVTLVREGKMRAQGVFRHPILAGTAGATALPFAYLLWNTGRRKLALLGMVACLGVVLASASSGPLAAVGITAASVFFWQRRHWLRLAFWSLLGLALLYPLLSGRGPWWLMSRIDLVGGSTGWHRAYLIDQAMIHLDEWWLIGTDYTRHWMPTGVSFSPNHSDLTNYYLHLGVLGGGALALCLIAFIIIAIRMLIRNLTDIPESAAILRWCAGASLVTHAVSFISISYFDQMYIFFYLLLGAIPGLVSNSTLNRNIVTPKMQVAEPIEARPLRFYS
jgi:hypothetical protein